MNVERHGVLNVKFKNLKLTFHTLSTQPNLAKKNLKSLGIKYDCLVLVLVVHSQLIKEFLS